MQSLDDATSALIAGLEGCSLEAFRHKDHLRAAWYYLRGAVFEEGAARFIGALRRFCAARGAAGAYHETITWAYLAILNERLRRPGAAALGFDEFLGENPDLAAPGFLREYYDPALLDSERARGVF